jgi:hypothetical protein
MTEALEPGFEIIPPPPKRGHGKLIGSIAAVVVLAAGGAVSYVAFAAGDSGASSPEKAVQNVVADLQNADLIGVLDDLAPGERAALSAPIRDDIASLKRLSVLSSSANPSAVSGVHFATHDLTYASKTITVNDHVQIVQITGGSVDLGADATKFPFTQRFLGVAKPPTKAANQHIAITAPVRIATEKVGDTWYASLFYTAADDAAGHAVPSASNSIPAHGADSAEGAVEKMVRALLSGDVTSALSLISPAELGAVHDYGSMILKAMPRWQAAQVTIKTLDLTTTPISDGVRVGLKNLVLSSGGRELSVAIDNGCATIAAAGFHKKVCPADAADLISTFLGGLTCASSFSFGSSSGSSAYHSRIDITTDGKSSSKTKNTYSQSHYVPLDNDGTLSGDGCQGPKFTAAQKQAIADLLSGITSLGIDTAKVDGQWFITPVRTVADLGATVLSGLKGDDLFQLATLGH